ncbi:unnamed protein product, partial [Ceratitis capitata]
QQVVASVTTTTTMAFAFCPERYTVAMRETFAKRFRKTLPQILMLSPFRQETNWRLIK